MSRTAGLLSCLAVGLILTGCLGLGDDEPAGVSWASDVTHDSAELSGRADCDDGSACVAHYRYRVAGSPRWLRAPLAGGHRLSDDDDNRLPEERIAGLRPGTRYQFETCTGKGRAERCSAPDGESPDSGRFTTRLRYSPPELVNPRTIRIDPIGYCQDTSSTGGTGSLPDDEDFVIELPSVPLPCPLDVRGGRNLVIRGGEIFIPKTNESPRNPELHRGLYLTNQTGVVHVEGVRLGGAELSVPIVLNESRGATVQLQRVRADRIFTDYPDWGPLHADCIQTWAGPTVLRVDGFTCTTDYFGLQLSPTQYGDNDLTWPEYMEFRHMNFRPWREDDLTRFMFWRTRTVARKDWWPITFDDVWTQPGYEGAGTEAALTCYSGNYKATIPENGGIWQEVSHDQNCGQWPKFGFGQPPDGDFVRGRDIGLGYRSPGY